MCGNFIGGCIEGDLKYTRLCIGWLCCEYNELGERKSH